MLVDGEKVSEIDTVGALALAEERDLDLVMLDDKKIPVCKIIDYNKYMFDQKKKIKGNAVSKQVTKEVRMSYKIAEHDINIKTNTIRRLISKNQRVKVSVVFKGREIKFKTMGIEIIDRIVEKLKNEVTISKNTTVGDNNVFIEFSPNKS